MPVSQVSEAPDNIQALAPKTGGGDKINLTLSQVNWILSRYDTLKAAEEKGDIESAMGVAISQFRDAYEAKDGKWEKHPEKKSLSTCSECGSVLQPAPEVETPVDKAASEAEKEAQAARAEKSGIAPKDGGNVTKPSKYADVSESSFGDPTNFSYPADAAHARPALGYFNHSDAREKGGYTSAEWTIIGGRLAKLISRHLDAEYEYKDGTLQQKPKKKAIEQSLDDEVSDVRDAYYVQFAPPDQQPSPGGWVKEVFLDYMIVDTPEGLMHYPYTRDQDGKIIFGAPSLVEQIYVPLPLPSKSKIAKAIARGLFLTLVRKDTVPIWQDAEGSRWYAAIISTAVQDEEDEIVTKAGMDFSIELCKKYGIQPGLHIQHEVPGTRIGDCLFEKRIGLFWFVIGRFRDTWLADKTYKALQKDKEGVWRVSIGFLAPVKQQKKGVYTKILRFDESLTDEPANLWTAIAVGGKTMKYENIMRLLCLDVEDEAERKSMEQALEDLLGAETKALTYVGKGVGGNTLATAMIKLEELEVEGEKAQGVVKEVLGLLGQAGDALLQEKEVPAEPVEPVEPVEPEPAKAEPVTEPVQDSVIETALATIQEQLTNVLGRLSVVEGAQTEVSANAALTKALLKRLPQAAIERPSTAAAPLNVDEVVPTMAEMTEALNKSVVAHPLAGLAGAPPESAGG